MENVTRAIIMAFSMLIFVIGFSYSMYLINRLTTTSNTLLSSVTTTNYYDNIKVSKNNATTTREVGIDAVISTLYRYYKENYAVKIYDDASHSNELIQVFDMNLEGKMPNAYKGYSGNNKELESLSNSIYADDTNRAYLFQAPWTGNPEDTKTRIDFFLNGTKGYIKDALVNYSVNSSTKIFEREGGFIANYGNRTFDESFVEYAYEGETISTEEGVETITGNTQENSKIIITYTVK